MFNAGIGGEYEFKKSNNSFKPKMILKMALKIFPHHQLDKGCSRWIHSEGNINYHF